MSITDDVSELYNVELEIKRLSASIKELRKQKHSCESRILEYLEVNDLPGIKFRNVVILAHQRKRQARIPRKDKEGLLQGVLDKHDISKEQYDAILNDLKGSPEYVPTLKIK